MNFCKYLYTTDEILPEDIRATFKTIESLYGTLDSYLQKVMALVKERRELFQKKFLEQ